MRSVHQLERYRCSWALTTLAAGARCYISYSSLLDDATITDGAGPCAAAVRGSRAEPVVGLPRQVAAAAQSQDEVVSCLDLVEALGLNPRAYMMLQVGESPL